MSPKVQSTGLGPDAVMHDGQRAMSNPLLLASGAGQEELGSLYESTADEAEV